LDWTDEGHTGPLFIRLFPHDDRYGNRAAKFGAFFPSLDRPTVPLSVHPVFLCRILPCIRDEAVCGADEAIAEMIRASDRE